MPDPGPFEIGKRWRDEARAARAAELHTPLVSVRVTFGGVGVQTPVEPRDLPGHDPTTSPRAQLWRAGVEALAQSIDAIAEKGGFDAV